MAKFDFPNAKPPELEPLKKSFAVDDIEGQVRDLAIAVFKERLSGAAFDLNVSGAQHLGSFPLVRRAVNAEGLALLRGDMEEAATRAAFRAWKGRNSQGRGMHFLRTYLQLLFPNVTSVAQLWHWTDQAQNYPAGLVFPDDGSGVEIDPSRMFLTSRIEVKIDLGLVNRSITQFVNIIRGIIPARLVPHFRLVIIFQTSFTPYATSCGYMLKAFDLRHQTATRVVTDREGRIWHLGREDSPNPPRLGDGMLQITASLKKDSLARYPSGHYVGEPGLRLDGLWVVSPFVPMSAEFDLVRTNA